MHLKSVLLAGTILIGGGLIGSSAMAGVCPTNIGSSGGCNVTITAGTGGSFSTVVNNPNPYDGSDDNLVGFVNNSGGTISSLTFSGTNLFSFDGDGLQSYVPGDGSDPTGYGGRDSTTGNANITGTANNFTVVSSSNGTVNFPGGIPNGGSAYFSLEGPPSLNLHPVPEPASLALLGSGLFGLAALRRRRKRS